MPFAHYNNHGIALELIVLSLPRASPSTNLSVDCYPVFERHCCLYPLVMSLALSTTATGSLTSHGPAYLNLIRIHRSSQTDSELNNLTKTVNSAIENKEFKQPKDPTPEWKIIARFFVKWGMMTNVVMFMLGMGATLTWSQVCLF